MDALILARMQFAANITFHILFPTVSKPPLHSSKAVAKAAHELG